MNKLDLKFQYPQTQLRKSDNFAEVKQTLTCKKKREQKAFTSCLKQKIDSRFMAMKTKGSIGTRIMGSKYLKIQTQKSKPQ